jgi:hypothetical protein
MLIAQFQKAAIASMFYNASHFGFGKAAIERRRSLGSPSIFQDLVHCMVGESIDRPSPWLFGNARYVAGR